MTINQIEQLFNEVIKERGISSKVEGFSKDVIYNWKKGKTIPPLGDMLSVLYQLSKIEIRKNYSLSA